MRLLTPALLLALLAPISTFARDKKPAPDLPRLQSFGGIAGDLTQRLAILVHGINPTPHDMDPLARNIRRRGYRVFMFHYNHNQHLPQSANQLAMEISQLLGRYPTGRVAVVAHSMGGLVARAALRHDNPIGLANLVQVGFELITVSTPFHGFVSANFSKLDFNLGPDSHNDLGSWTKFIRKPGALAANVRHIKVETDEAKRTIWRDGKEVDDSVIKKKHQRQKVVDRGVHRRYELKLGHSEVLRGKRGEGPPAGLSAILDRWLGPAPHRLCPRTWAMMERIRSRLAQRRLDRQGADRQRALPAGARQGASGALRASQSRSPAPKTPKR